MHIKHYQHWSLPGDENRLIHFGYSSGERKQAYKEASEAENAAQGNMGMGLVLNEQDRVLDQVIQKTNAAWPEWTKYMGLQTKSNAAYWAMRDEARIRLLDKNPELDVGWWKWVVSSSTRRAFYTAESQIYQNIAEESKKKLDEQDHELEMQAARYNRKKKMFAEGGVKISLKNTKKKSSVVRAIEKAADMAKEEYKDYKDFPPEVKLAVEDEEMLVDDLVTRYEVIEPNEVDRMFQDNEDGGKLLDSRIRSYFDGAEYTLKASEGARRLQDLIRTQGADGKKKISEVRNALIASLKRLRFSRFRNRKVSYYRTLLRLKNPNASPDSQRQYLLERKPVAGARITFNSPLLGPLVAFTKCKQGETCIRVKDTAGKTYVLDIGSNDVDREKMWLVREPKKRGGEPEDVQLDWRHIQISPT